MFIYPVQLSGLVVVPALRLAGCKLNPQLCYTKDCKYGSHCLPAGTQVPFRVFTVGSVLHYC